MPAGEARPRAHASAPSSAFEDPRVLTVMLAEDRQTGKTPLSPKERGFSCDVSGKEDGRDPLPCASAEVRRNARLARYEPPPPPAIEAGWPGSSRVLPVLVTSVPSTFRIEMSLSR